MIIPMMSNEIFVSAANIGDINGQIEAMEYRLNFAKSIGNEAAVKKIEEELAALRSIVRDTNGGNVQIEGPPPNSNIYEEEEWTPKSGLNIWRSDDPRPPQVYEEEWQWTPLMTPGARQLLATVPFPVSARAYDRYFDAPYRLREIVSSYNGQGPRIIECDYYGNTLYIIITYDHRYHNRGEIDSLVPTISDRVTNQDSLELQQSAVAWENDFQRIAGIDVGQRPANDEEDSDTGPTDQDGNLVAYDGDNTYILYTNDDTPPNMFETQYYTWPLTSDNVYISDDFRDLLRQLMVQIICNRPMPNTPGLYICLLRNIRYYLAIRENSINMFQSAAPLEEDYRNSLPEPRPESDVTVYRADDTRAHSLLGAFDGEIIDWMEDDRIDISAEAEILLRVYPVPLGDRVAFSLISEDTLPPDPVMWTIDYYGHELVLLSYYEDSDDGGSWVHHHIKIRDEITNDDLDAIAIT